MKRAPRRLAALLVGVYQRFVSPALPRRCKYEPTCSAYAAEAIRELGAFRGLLVACWRLLRCTPFSHGGFDPLEARRLFRDGPQGDPEAGASARAGHAHTGTPT